MATKDPGKGGKKDSSKKPASKKYRKGKSEEVRNKGDKKDVLDTGKITKSRRKK